MRIIFTVIIFSSLIANAQKNDRTAYLCKYNFDWQKDSTKPSSKFRDIMYLEIGNSSSKYYSYLKQVGNKNAKQDMANNKPIDFMAENNGRYFPESETEIIITNFKNGKIKVLDRPGLNAYVYFDSIQKINWEISEDTLTYLNQTCQKAFCSFRGRRYTAWFCQSIPYSLGPWLFTGLPGLILKISDSKGEFVFKCTELISKPNELPYCEEYENPTTITKKRLRELKRLKAVDITEFDKIDIPGITITYSNSKGDPIPVKRKPNPYNPIDLSK